MKPGEAETRLIFDFRMKFDYNLMRVVTEKMVDEIQKLVTDGAWEMWIVPKHLMKREIPK